MTTLNLSDSTAGGPRIMTTRAALKAALRIAAKQDIRYYLNGINIEADAKSTRLIATDGNAMLILHHDADNRLDAPVSFIVPRSVVNAAIAGAGKGLARVPLEFRPEGTGMWSVPLLHLGDRSRLTFAQVEAKFPDWQRVVPATVSGKAAQLNPAILTNMSAAAADLGSRYITVAYNGDAPALVRPQSQIVEQFIGLVMPMSDFGAARNWTLPAWCTKPGKPLENFQ